MHNIMRDLGDANGLGHKLEVMLEGASFGIIVSRNPDTGQSQRIVILESQWRALQKLLNEVYRQN
jgi:hypothetical protein